MPSPVSVSNGSTERKSNESLPNVYGCGVDGLLDGVGRLAPTNDSSRLLRPL